MLWFLLTASIAHAGLKSDVLMIKKGQSRTSVIEKLGDPVSWGPLETPGSEALHYIDYENDDVCSVGLLKNKVVATTCEHVNRPKAEANIYEQTMPEPTPSKFHKIMQAISAGSKGFADGFNGARQSRQAPTNVQCTSYTSGGATQTNCTGN